MGAYFRQDYLTTPDGARIYFQVQGDGEPGMVLCDGLGCDGFAWKYLAPSLKQHFRVLRWHYRGHGRSTLPDDPARVGMDYACEDLDRVMDEVGMRQAVVFGHSMGTQVALEFHRTHPERVRGLVLVCGSYGNPLDTFHDGPMLRIAFPYVREAVEKHPKLAALVVKGTLSTELAVQVAIYMETNRELMQRQDLIPYFDHLIRMDPVTFVRTLHSCSTHDAWPHLPQIDVPTLVIGGERDKFTPVWLSRRMADAIPTSEILLVRGGTHTAPLEYPHLVWDRIKEFLDRRVLPLPRAKVVKKPADARRLA